MKTADKKAGNSKIKKSSSSKVKKAKKNLVIVESPAKANTIMKFLGKSYTVMASMGHVRDLPKSQLGVDIENDYEPKYITIRGKGELLSSLRKEAKNADHIYLATDPDREGEAISWHLMTALNLDKEKTDRITFNEITKDAVEKSIKSAREIDMDLVNAQQARRVLDRLVGYPISNLLWQKVKGRLSAGRVQSAALRIICQREDEIRSFIPEEYWTIIAVVADSANNKFEAKFYGTTESKIELQSKEQTDKILEEVSGSDFIVKEIKKSEKIRRPYPPFTTSTLQQEASKYLNFTAQRTMMLAQQLYEGIEIKGHGTVGLVSYIRTDSVRVSDEAYGNATDYIKENIGEKYIPEERNVYKTKKNAQDAHEAIRPTYASMTPESVKESLSNDQFKLYKLIWERFISSQMSPAIYETMSVLIENKSYLFKITASVIVFKGFLEVYNRVEETENITKFPKLNENAVLKLDKMLPEQHFTQPPARYTDASLVKTLEELGIGRPSTYAPILGTIIARNYVTKEKKSIYPTELGEIIDNIMKEYFPEIVNISFTANMESELDRVEEGFDEWKQIIRDFYPTFVNQMDNAMENLQKIEIKDEESDVVCEKCGRKMVIKFGKYGKFLACPGYPECNNAKPYFESVDAECPKCGGKIYKKKSKKGRVYYGCEHNPECDFVSWDKPAKEKCPRCGSYMVEKGHDPVKLLCSNEKCGYAEEKKNEEE
ncbi:MAG: type I DNA topoisomerase [Candidatus Metalachnospira sp.]|nr:type I DNA topoisomerase [Candidatus Metalachnospira sp.]